MSGQLLVRLLLRLDLPESRPRPPGLPAASTGEHHNNKIPDTGMLHAVPINMPRESLHYHLGPTNTHVRLRSRRLALPLGCLGLLLRLRLLPCPLSLSLPLPLARLPLRLLLRPRRPVPRGSAEVLPLVAPPSLPPASPPLSPGDFALALPLPRVRSLLGLRLVLRPRGRFVGRPSSGGASLSLAPALMSSSRALGVRKRG